MRIFLLKIHVGDRKMLKSLQHAEKFRQCAVTKLVYWDAQRLLLKCRHLCSEVSRTPLISAIEFRDLAVGINKRRA